MLANPLVVENNDIAGDASYEILKDIPGGTRRYNAVGTTAEPIFLNIQHTESGPKKAVIDRHLTQGLLIKKDPVTGEDVPLTINVTVACPRNPVITEAMVKDLLCNVLTCWISVNGGTGEIQAHPTNFPKLMRGES